MRIFNWKWSKTTKITNYTFVYSSHAYFHSSLIKEWLTSSPLYCFFSSHYTGNVLAPKFATYPNNKPFRVNVFSANKSKVCSLAGRTDIIVYHPGRQILLLHTHLHLLLTSSNKFLWVTGTIPHTRSFQTKLRTCALLIPRGVWKTICLFFFCRNCVLT